jgi:putative endonuclease
MVFVPDHLRFVYVLKNTESTPRFYVGLTAEVEARLAQHNAGRSTHTSRYRPWHLHVVIQFPDETRAVRFERYLKSGSGRAFARRHFGP